jgi:hypothetical protein
MVSSMVDGALRKQNAEETDCMEVGMLNQGKLSWATKKGRDYERHKTAVTRVSRSGKKQFQGRKPQLKASQCLACGGIYTFFGKLLMGMDMRICFK